MKYDKLIRDKIPYIVQDESKCAIIHIATPEQKVEYLEKKLLEEVDELLRASEDERVAELSDIAEVVLELISVHPTLKGVMEKKRETNGGFSIGYILKEIKEATC